jgi:hypothetical protein
VGTRTTNSSSNANTDMGTNPRSRSTSRDNRDRARGGGRSVGGGTPSSGGRRPPRGSPGSPLVAAAGRSEVARAGGVRSPSHQHTETVTSVDVTTTAVPAYFQRSAEITDIDARLQALQTFLANAKGVPT